MTLYYVEDAEIYLKNMSEDKSLLPVPLGEDVIEIQSEEHKAMLIQSILRHEFVEDNKLQQFFEENLPLLSKTVSEVPIDVDTFKIELNNLFDDIPEEIIEHKSFFEAMKAIINFLMRKSEAQFYIINIQNGKLIYNTKYVHKQHYAFYFKLIKLNYGLEELIPFYFNIQRLLEMIFLKDIYYAPKETVTRKRLQIFQESHNLIVRNYATLRYQLQNMKDKILKERIYIKRAKINLPREYWTEEESLLQKIVLLEKHITTEIERAEHRKKKIEQLLLDTSLWKKIKDYAEFLQYLNFKSWL